MILDPRFKCELLKQEFEDEKASSFLIAQLRGFSHRHYPPAPELEPLLQLPPSQKPILRRNCVFAKLLGQSRHVSDVDRYFDDGIISLANLNGVSRFLSSSNFPRFDRIIQLVISWLLKL
ncbi:uncharacterized protein V1513DRAFT_256231 [Lipomyces chichibuensis]|uniref:uncharacterized protein n=1 Tax=Lipomyces chichibuensis TaxID=1546026 RepID=UPI00334362C6